ncbi:MAG: tRNA pseudouridine(55) synthase TruB [Clostridia bacterium]|nr:tRNA pseudouridine(55) synthase TruB [Clostridia bacterium]MBQ9958018.1 tRNA pseudouridine(55) synthase TruB [Clostridia bacterium]
MQGMILLDKPEGMTSFSAVSAVKRIFGEKRVGHTGTLDPMATGVLPILLGRATRLCELMLTADKRYTAEVLLGVETDTLDITGNVISETDCDISVAEFESVCSRFIGEYEQVPPMFSALKKDGVRLYDLARQGVEIEREARLVNIKKLDIIEKSGKNKFIIDVICSKGTYIRSLADDLGKALGVGATLTMLRRTETAGYTADMCVTLDELKENPQKYLREADSVVAYCPSVNVTDNQTRRFLNGGELFLERINFDTEVSDGDLIRVYSYDNKFLGLGLVDGELLKIKCIITE